MTCGSPKIPEVIVRANDVLNRIHAFRERWLTRMLPETDRLSADAARVIEQLKEHAADEYTRGKADGRRLAEERMIERITGRVA